MKKIIIPSLLLLGLVAGGVALGSNKPKSSEVSAATSTVTTNFQTDWEENGIEPGSVLVSYVSTNGGAQLPANSTSRTNINNSLTTPDYALIRIKNHSSDALVLTLFYRITSNADGCTGGSLVSSALSNSSFTRFSSGSGCYVSVGALDDAVFRVDLNSGAYSKVCLGINIGVNDTKTGLFTVQSWKTHDASNDSLVDTLYTFDNVKSSSSSGKLMAVAAAAGTAEYKELATSNGSGALEDGFEGLPLNFYDGTHSTYNNPSPSFKLRTFGAYKGVHLRKKTSDAAARLLVGYGTNTSTPGCSVVISCTNSDCTMTQINLTHRTDVNWNDDLYYATSSDHGVTYTYTDDTSTLVKVDWTASGSGKTAAIAVSSGVTDVKLINFSGESGARSDVGFASIEVNYTEVGSYTLSFDTQGGTNVPSQVIHPSNSEVTVEPATNPTHEDEDGYRYTFDGWYDAAVGGNEFVFGSTINADTTVYAHWSLEEIASYTLTFDTNGGSAIAPQVVSIGSTPTKPSNPTKVDADPTRYSYTFKDWYTDTTYKTKFNFNAELTGDTTAYACFERVAYEPAGASNYNVKSGLHDSKNTGWGDGEEFSSYAAREIPSYGKFSSSLPQINLSITSSGANSGMKRNNWEFVLNDTTMTLDVLDTTKYISSIRIEALCQVYSISYAQNVTLRAGGVTLDTQLCPYDAHEHVVWMHTFNSNERVTSVDLVVPAIRTNYGMGLTNVIIEYGTFSVADYAIAYAVQFNDDAVCGSSASDGLNTTKWGNQSDNYTALAEEVRAYLTAYDWENGENDELNECLERYDRVIYLHGEDYDFMGRISAGKVSPIVNTNSLTNYNGMADGNTSIVIIVVSLASVSALAILVLIKRKKQL